MFRIVSLAFLTAVASLGTAASAQDGSRPEAHRTVYLKLPIAETGYHWRFTDRDAFLAGKLTLHIHSDRGHEPIVIFSSGIISPGWEPIESGPPNQIYFGFESSSRYRTGPTDSLVIELEVTQDVSGVGPRFSGTLPEGSYRSTGSYSTLVGYWSELWLETIADLERIPLDELIAMPEAQALATRLNETTSDMELKAFAQCWREPWAVTKTGPGWLTPEQLARNDSADAAHAAQLAEMRADLVELGVDPGPEGQVGTDGRPCLTLGR